MNNTCVGPCSHDVSCKTAGSAASGLDTRVTKLLDKMPPIPNALNANARIGFYQGDSQTRAFRDFHSSHDEKNATANRVLEILCSAVRVEKLDQIRSS